MSAALYDNVCPGEPGVSSYFGSSASKLKPAKEEGEEEVAGLDEELGDSDGPSRLVLAVEKSCANCSR